MLRIDSKAAAGGIVRLAPWGTEDGPTPCLVWVDPNPNPLGGAYCKVQDAAGNLVSAATERGLRSAAMRLNCRISEERYVP